MEGGLSIHEERIAVAQVPVYDLATGLEFVGDAVTLLVAHAREERLSAGLLVKDHVSAGMHQGSISHHHRQALSIDLADTLREGQLAGHEDGHTDLICGDVGVGGDDGAATVVDTLAHHLLAEHAFFAFEKLSDTLLFLLSCFLGHRAVHKSVDSILKLDPELVDTLNVFLICLLLLWHFWLLQINNRRTKVYIRLDHLGEHGRMLMEEDGAVTALATTHGSFRLRTESSGRHYDKVHEEYLVPLTLHIKQRVLTRIKLSVQQTQKRLLLTPQLLQMLHHIIRADVLLLS